MLKFLWILWAIWKTRNSHMIQGHTLNLHEAFREVIQNLECWDKSNPMTTASNKRQSVDYIPYIDIATTRHQTMVNWKVKWVSHGNLNGAAFVITKNDNLIWLHARHVISNATSLMNLEFMSLIWVLCSLLELNVLQVEIEIDNKTLFSIILVPTNWLHYRAWNKKFQDIAVGFIDLHSTRIHPRSNAKATAITCSVVIEGRFNDYIAWREPRWINQLSHLDLANNSNHFHLTSSSSP